MTGIIGIVVIAWLGLLDDLSAAYIDGALIGSGAIYATARGINALVSVLQGTEMNAVLLTFTVGELLDPVNDLVERFSGLMMLALGSLALQKILLELVSDMSFNILLTGLGVAVAASHYLGFDAVYRKLARFFLVTAAIRFSFAVVILANSWADSVFLEDGVNSRHAGMQGFHKELSSISARAGIDAGLSDEGKSIEAQIEVNDKALQQETTNLHRNRTRLQATEAKLEAIDQRPWWKKLSGETTLAIEETELEIQQLERTIEGNELTISGLRDTSDALHEQLDCLEKRRTGESCSFLGGIGKAAQAFNIRQQINALSADVDQFASNLISLLMALILKSVIFPLLFLYILVRAVRHAL
ncbi:hypothetical protein DWB85_10530 [Seongchinamella sediminis]|uniref:Uncharacterized protein n=1 Tax=Seongchinamella sediminis TaxID=2283635 RepID=A0A3L7E0F6_9GAMM|nr:hypothetical protein DWB85_10530 [Seongchinamella sediminis]